MGKTHWTERTGCLQAVVWNSHERDIQEGILCTQEDLASIVMPTLRLQGRKTNLATFILHASSCVQCLHFKMASPSLNISLTWTQSKIGFNPRKAWRPNAALRWLPLTPHALSHMEIEWGSQETNRATLFQKVGWERWQDGGRCSVTSCSTFLHAGEGSPLPLSLQLLLVKVVGKQNDGDWDVLLPEGSSAEPMDKEQELSWRRIQGGEVGVWGCLCVLEEVGDDRAAWASSPVRNIILGDNLHKSF